VLSPLVAPVVIANPLQVKAIAHAHVKTDKVDAGTLANLIAAGYLPEIWAPDARANRLRRLVARRYQIVRHRTRVKGEVHAIPAAHLVPKCPHRSVHQRGRAWLARQMVPDDERLAIDRGIRELDRLTKDRAELDREIALSVMDDASVRRLMTITGVNLTVAAGVMAAIGDITRFKCPQKLVSYFGLNPRVRQSGLGVAITAASARSAAAMPAPCWSRRPGRRRRRRGRGTPSPCAYGRSGATRSPRWRSPASSPCCAGIC
jgi:transposase